MHSLVSPDKLPPVVSRGDPAQPAARQAADSGQGTADARRADNDSAAAAVPSSEEPWRWAPRPKPDPLTQEPECGWATARKVQAKRRAAVTAARRHRPRQIKTAGVSALQAARAIDAIELELERQKCPIEQAALALRRRGRIVYRLSVHGGPRDTFFCSGKRLTERELVIEAGTLGQ